ncbi:SOS response-associated peptidase family protein [Lysobacter capsici]|uniref:SOS response-associated peptidase family protein n=1 Tax=Lysobacter capsici TaxID=435897 RepID=UPI0007167613|nr:SOS response-associated peptidase family protein [Lysobacter capsici]
MVIASRFYESVDYYRYKPSGAHDRSIELVFTPDTGQDMAIACLYSHWVNPDPEGDDLWSFAFITTDPPPEVAAAGHDRCIMPIKPENIDRWLQPAPNDLARFYEILEDRERPYYNHAVVKGLGDGD